MGKYLFLQSRASIPKWRRMHVETRSIHSTENLFHWNHVRFSSYLHKRKLYFRYKFTKTKTKLDRFINLGLYQQINCPRSNIRCQSIKNVINQKIIGCNISFRLDSLEFSSLFVMYRTTYTFDCKIYDEDFSEI